MSTVRLALSNAQAERPDTNATLCIPESPAVRLATVVSHGNLSPENTEKNLRDWKDAPALLVSYVYLDGFLKHREKYCFRDWVLDSGAFSAHNSGTTISLQAYIDTAKRLLETDGKLTEVFALDVIGNAKASLRNCEEMWRQGIEAIPTYHRGSPEADLKHIAKDYPKIALGGVAMLRGDAKMNWAKQCFARVWPKKIHGFGFGAESQVLGLPWHSVDATNWEIGPCAFGQWKKFGKMSVRGSNQNLRSQVEHYLEMEKKSRVRWKKEMAQLAAMDAPVVRLAAQQDTNAQVKRSGLLAPTVRLAQTTSGHDAAKQAALAPTNIYLATQGDSQGARFLKRNP